MTDASEKPWAEQLIEGINDLGADAFRSGGVRVYVKTNLGPEIRVSGGEGPGLVDLLGVKAAVVVRDRRGHTLITYGDPPETDWIRAGALALTVGALLFTFLRGVFKK